MNNRPSQAAISAAMAAQAPAKAGATERAMNREAVAARDLLAQIAPDDEELAHDMVEGETSFLEAVAAAVAEIDQANAISDGLNSLIHRYEARQAAADRRAERIRAAIEQAMTVAGMVTLTLPAATLTVKAVPPKPLIADESAIPAEFWIAQPPRLDKTALNKAVKAGPVAGVTMTNGGSTLQIRKA